MVTTKIPGYRFVEIAHRGRRHMVWRVVRESDGRNLILKTTEDPSRADLLRREHALLAALDIPGVVKAIALDEHGPYPALVLEDAGPQDLTAWLHSQSGLIDPGQFLTMAVKLSAIVAGLHARSLIHRDIAPFNFVTDAGGARFTLVDFNAAISTAAVARPATLHRLEGALAYMAPEQTGRLNRVVDHRADLYSLGVTFYEMVCGAVPFSSSDPVEVMHAHLARSPAAPASIHPRIPATVSNIILRLLKKTPEDRYQSAEALLADLKEGQRQWREGERITPFRLGQADLAKALPHRTAFQGRAREVELLTAAIDGAAGGESAVVLVRGVAGIGKSALVSEVAGAHSSALVLTGKCDAVPREVPYQPLAEAFGKLFRTVAEGPPEALVALRQRLKTKIGSNLSILAAALPGLGDVAGDIPTAPTLGATEAEQRFQLTFAALVRILGEGRPVVLFLDDLQWADSATLRLMEYLAGDPGDLHLLLIAAYRVAEMAAEGPTARALATLTGAALPVFTIDLGPLSLDEVTALCADILGATQERAAPLAAYAHKKTEGNAFFVQQFLRSLVADGHLAFDLSDSAWHWDMADVARLGTTANADLVTKAIRGLPARTRHALTVAACFSHHVELSLLAQLLGQSVDDTAADLWAAIDADLLIPAAITPAGSVAYQFLHDRVHQAAQSLLSEDEKQHIHLEIGSQLSAGTSPESLEERLFDAVDQLNLGAAVITADTHRLKIAKLNLRAGEKARSQAAYGPALGYLSRGIELTRKIDPALVPHALVFRLFRHATECAFLSGDVERAEKLAQAALDIAESTLEKLEIFNIHITAFASRGEHAEALRLGHVGFALFDDALPPAPTPPQLLEIFAAMRAKLANRPPQALLGQPRMVDRTILAQMELLANLLSPAFVSDQMLFAALVSRMVTLSLDHGSSVYSSFAYAAYGMLTCAFEKAYAQGHAWGQLGVALARRFGDPVQECRAIHSFTCFLSHWRAPLASTLPVVRTGIVRGIESGELQFGTLCQSTLVVTLYHMGVELSQLINELDVSLPLARRTHNKAACEYQLAYRQAARCLQGNTRDLATFDDDGFSEAGHLEATADNPVALALYLVLRLEASYLAGDLETARAMADRAAPVVVTIGVLFPIAEYHLYSALAFAGEAKTSTAARDRVATHVAALAPFAETCPQNFAAKHRLAAAALAIVDGDPDGAAALYDDAIDAAHDARFVKDEALACELAARLWRHRGRERIARMYLGESLAAYRRWGALAKVAALEEQIPQPVAAELSAWRPPRIAVDARGRAFDLLGLLRAAGTISSEVAIDRLVANLLEVCFELAGATRGGLIVAEKDELLVLALGATTEPVTVARTPLEACRDLPAEVIRLAWEAGTQVVAADASRDRRLAGDPYFAREKIRSALIMPIRRQAAAMGVLYLENRLMADVFSSERVQVLRLLSSQIAISLENSLLFEKLRFESGENARLYAEAQESIRLRNEFLSIASHELKTPITSIQLVVQGLLSSLSSSPQTFPQVSRIAERQVLRLSSLVDELLTVSRIQEGRLHLSLEEVDLVSLTHEVVERFAFQSAQARCEVVIRNDPAVIGHWDRSRLDQVLTNLLSNAIKFGPGKPIDIEVRRHHGHAQLTITDHGIGIPAERIPHIFKRFERAVPASRYGGLGLGLYIAYQIAQALGATIDVTSEIGAGATFTLTLPLAAELRAGEDGVGRGL